MSRLGFAWTILSRYKYLIVVAIGVAIVGFIDENSFVKRLQLSLRIRDLKAEIQKYQDANEADTKQLKELRRDPKAIEKIAREQYFMKTDDEDVFQLSDDEDYIQKNNETNE